MTKKDFLRMKLRRPIVVSWGGKRYFWVSKREVTGTCFLQPCPRPSYKKRPLATGYERVIIERAGECE